MKTKTAGKQQANIIQMGNLPSEPRGLMSQPRLVGLVTEKPLGTLSFCTENDHAVMTTLEMKVKRVLEAERGS